MLVEGLVLRDLDLLVEQEGPAEGVQDNYRLCVCVWAEREEIKQ